MEKGFLCGLALGMIGGALIVANSRKAREAVAKGQSEILARASELGKKEPKSADKSDDRPAGKSAAKSASAGK